MLRTVLEMTVREGCEEEFRDAWLATARTAAELPGSIAQTLLRRPDDPRVHVVMADWADRAALEAFRNSPDRERLSARLERFRESAEKHVLETVAHVPATTRPVPSTPSAPSVRPT